MSRLLSQADRSPGAPCPPDVLDNHARYKPICWLGAGSFGSVVKAEDLQAHRQSQRHVAIKLLPRGYKIDENVKREIQNHHQLRHPHIVSFNRAFLTSSHLAIVMEYCNQGTMYDYVIKRQYEDGERERGRLREDEARWYFQQLIIAVDYLHKSGVACRDIKLENALLGGNALAPHRLPLKLCDLGYSKSVLDSVPTSRVGTICYMAPEVVLCKQGDCYDAFVADLWSVGCFLYVMVTGTYPFFRNEDLLLQPHEQQLAIMKRTVEGDYAMPACLMQGSPALRDLLMRLLTVDTQRRATLNDVINHPWFREDLPQGALTINPPGRNPITSQSAEEVARIIRLARTTDDDMSLLF